MSVDAVVVRGRVRWYEPANGFGYIVPDDNAPDDFVYVTAVEKAGLKTLEMGMVLEYTRVWDRDNRVSAQNLVVVDQQKGNKDADNSLVEAQG